MEAKVLRVAMIGHGFMGAAHSQGWRVAPRFYDLPLLPQMHLLVGRDEKKVTRAAQQYGWSEIETDWRKAVERDDIDAVDICAQGSVHAEIAIAALRAGKHVLCEKPLANSVVEAEAMVQAARSARSRSVRSMVGFTYRRLPALALLHDLIAEGRIGVIRQIRARYLQDWLSDVDSPMTWRLDKAQAGSGALGDLGSHIVDLAEFLSGQSVTEVSGTLRTFVRERPLVGESIGLSGVPRSERGTVTVDDAATFRGRLSGGGLATFEASRVATGHKNGLSIELSGSAGSLSFDLENMNVLKFYDGSASSRVAGFSRILVTEPVHPYVGAWWPPGHALGYEHGFSNQVLDFVMAISNGVDPSPSFEEGLHVQKVLEAVERSDLGTGQWVDVE